MDRKVFVSYKYADTLVKDLGVYEKNIWGQMVRVDSPPLCRQVARKNRKRQYKPW